MLLRRGTAHVLAIAPDVQAGAVRVTRARGIPHDADVGASDAHVGCRKPWHQTEGEDFEVPCVCAQSDQPRENKVVERAMEVVRATPTKRVAAVAVAEASGTRPWFNAVQFPPRDPVTVVRVQVLINVGREPSSDCERVWAIAYVRGNASKARCPPSAVADRSVAG